MAYIGLDPARIPGQLFNKKMPGKVNENILHYYYCKTKTIAT